MGSANNKAAGKTECYSFRTQNVSICMKDCVKRYSDHSLPIPKGRSGHRITTDDSNLYTFGGYNPILDPYEEQIVDGNDEEADNYRLFKEIWRFNYVTKEWALLNIARDSFPDQLASTVVEMIDNTMVVHGGTGMPFGAFSSNSTYTLNLKQANQLTQLKTSGKLPDPMYGQASFLDKENLILYLVGGTSGINFFMDVHSLDLKTLTWEILGNTPRESPEGRYRHEIALYDCKLIIFGGGTIDHAFDFQGLPAFDLKTQRWQTLWTKGYRNARMAQPKFPAPRRCHGGIMVPAEAGRDAEFIISGGYNGRRSFADIWSLNLRTKQWYKWNSTLPQPLYFHACALTREGKLVIFGGIKSSDRSVEPEYPERTNQVLTTWVKIPKLTEIAWEAITHYAPQVAHFQKTHLLQLGVPRQFADRIYHSYNT